MSKEHFSVDGTLIEALASLKSPFVGREKLDFQFVLTFAAYKLIRMRNPGVVSC